jgi:hypothetical protein
MADEDKGKVGGPDEEQSPEEQDYVQMIMDRHKPVTQRGAGAIARAILIPLVIIIIILAVVWVALVNVGDSYSSATLAEVMRQSKKPVVQQNVVQRLFTPNFDHLKSMAVPQVLYSGRSDMILPGGFRVRLEGVTNLRDIFKRARKMGSAPVLKMNASDGRIHVEKMMILEEVAVENVEMKFVEKLTLLKRMPDRSPKDEPGKIRRAPQFAYDDDETFKKFVGRIIAIAGKPVKEDDRWILVADTWKMVLRFPPEEKGLDTILELAKQNEEPLMVDVLFSESYSWKNRKHPEKSRSETQIIGEADLLSASLQGLHVGLSAEETPES